MAFLTRESQVNCNPTIVQPGDPPLSRVATKGNRTQAAAPLTTVELADGICAKTSIPIANHSAMRSGFAGQPVNPRWSATKVVAWKTGREWRQGLSTGVLVIRETDSLLVPAIPPAVPTLPVPTPSTTTIPAAHPKPQGLFCFLPWRRSPQS